jgi:hypothetical protein
MRSADRVRSPRRWATWDGGDRDPPDAGKNLLGWDVHSPPTTGSGLRWTHGQRWEAYRWHVYRRRSVFDRQHYFLQWVPFASVLTFLLSTALALIISTARIDSGILSYLHGLLILGAGMVAVEIMGLLVGHAMWREQRDFRYLAFAIAFVSLPTWGALEGVCRSGLIPDLSGSAVCTVSAPLGALAVGWLITVPIVAVLLDFRRYVRRRDATGA